MEINIQMKYDLGTFDLSISSIMLAKIHNPPKIEDIIIQINRPVYSLRYQRKP